MLAGKVAIRNLDGAEQFSKISRERFAPDAIHSIFQDVVKFMYFKRLGQKMDTFLMEFFSLRQKAESRMLMGAGFSGECVPVVCVQNAGLARNERTMVLASIGTYLGLPTGIISDAAFFWLLRQCVATGCTRGAGYGYGVR